MDTEFIDNTGDSRFELHINGNTAYARYHIEGDILYIDYVEAPPQLRGTGAAGILMSKILDQAKVRSLKIIPICSYAALWLARNTAKE